MTINISKDKLKEVIKNYREDKAFDTKKQDLDFTHVGIHKNHDKYFLITFLILLSIAIVLSLIMIFSSAHLATHSLLEHVAFSIMASFMITALSSVVLGPVLFNLLFFFIKSSYFLRFYLIKRIDDEKITLEFKNNDWNFFTEKRQNFFETKSNEIKDLDTISLLTKLFEKDLDKATSILLLEMDPKYQAKIKNQKENDEKDLFKGKIKDKIKLEEKKLLRELLGKIEDEKLKNEIEEKLDRYQDKLQAKEMMAND